MQFIFEIHSINNVTVKWIFPTTLVDWFILSKSLLLTEFSFFTLQICKWLKPWSHLQFIPTFCPIILPRAEGSYQCGARVGLTDLWVWTIELRWINQPQTHLPTAETWLHHLSVKWFQGWYLQKMWCLSGRGDLPTRDKNNLWTLMKIFEINPR